MTRTDDIEIVRDAIAGLEEYAAWSAERAPVPTEIFTPIEHRNALDLDRTIVVGNRGVGKTFWARALVDSPARQHIAKLYPRLKLSNIEAHFGFSGGYGEGAMPSAATISDAEAVGVDEARIWEAVLLRYVAHRTELPRGEDLRTVVRWLSENAERGERALRTADARIEAEGKRLLLVFDGLDALGDTWDVIRRRLSGLIRFARLAKSLRTIKIKIFLRIDQAEDSQLWQSPDSSKLYNERVRLRWDQQALYGLLFFHLSNQVEAAGALSRIASHGRTQFELDPDRYSSLFRSQELQRFLFTAIAGESMGGGSNRGNTYNWVVNHLADAHGETTPRAFLIALAHAAKHATRPSTVIDHLSIQAGVQEASERRLKELEEDYWWIQIAFQPLADARVPCLPQDFLDRWVNADTAKLIEKQAKLSHKLPPIEFTSQSPMSSEERLLRSLILIGVVERRTNGNINMPDIFRVAARIKRKGGVRPPHRPGKS